MIREHICVHRKYYIFSIEGASINKLGSNKYILYNKLLCFMEQTQPFLISIDSLLHAFWQV